MNNKEEDLKHAVWTIRSIIADDAFAASHQSLGQYRTALLTGIAKVMGEILLGEPTQHPALQALQQECDELRSQAEALTKDLADANDSAAWHKRRTSLLQSLQSTMQEPERTIVCDVLANGHLLQGPDGKPDKQRYTTPSPLTRPAVFETEVHEPKCPALDGGDCICTRGDKHDQAVDRSWARFCAKFGDGPDAPYPGMISAFERYYSQSFADKEWRTESAVWAAAWKAALLAADPQRKLDDLEIQNASLESEVWHLSTLCDEQRAILVDVEKEFGTDAHGIEFEDGDSKLIDRIRAHLAMLATPQPEATIKDRLQVEAQPTEAAQKGGV